MRPEKELKINARGLSSPGPRLMVETALAKKQYESIRVVVSNEEALTDLREYLDSLGAVTDIDHIGDDYHIFADFPPPAKP